jgi:tripeptide aminopeptidase
VKPIVHRDYQGQDIVLPDDPGAVLRPGEIPELREHVGHDLVTASGATLLGADNKTGVAEIVAAAEYLVRHPEIPHGAVRIAFTPDEEIGAGVLHFDVKRFGAAAAYTMDGVGCGQLEIETFSADTLIVTFEGFNTHPGYAKGKMVNAVKAAADFVARLPRDRTSPETTGGHEGYVHPYVVEGGVERARVRVLIRDFATAALKEKERMLETLAREAAGSRPGCRASFELLESYRNMKEVLDRHPRVVDHAREAIRRAGLTPTERPIRGGTDGARLCFMGLPTPNIFSGQYNFHSRLEWTSAQDMEKAVETIVHLCRIWEERGAPA